MKLLSLFKKFDHSTECEEKFLVKHPNNIQDHCHQQFPRTVHLPANIEKNPFALMIQDSSKNFFPFFSSVAIFTPF